MKTFTVQFHREDEVEAMKVQKLNQQDFDKATEGGNKAFI